MTFESILSTELNKEREKCQDLMMKNFDLSSRLKAANSRIDELETKLREFELKINQ